MSGRGLNNSALATRFTPPGVFTSSKLPKRPFDRRARQLSGPGSELACRIYKALRHLVTHVRSMRVSDR